MDEKNIIVAITGASGAIYAQRLLQVLNKKDIHLHVVISETAISVIDQELGISLEIDDIKLENLLGTKSRNMTFYNLYDLTSQIISGGFKTMGMVIVPCSMNSLCSIANGIASNIIYRAASVTLKEGRRLVLVPRETPLTQIHLENMLKLSNAQVCILPAMPGFYHKPKTIDDQVDFIVAKILDYLHIEHKIDIRYTI